MTPDELEDIGPRNLKIITSISQLENVLTVIAGSILESVSSHLNFQSRDPQK